MKVPTRPFSCSDLNADKAIIILFLVPCLCQHHMNTLLYFMIERGTEWPSVVLPEHSWNHSTFI